MSGCPILHQEINKVQEKRFYYCFLLHSHRWVFNKCYEHITDTLKGMRNRSTCTVKPHMYNETTHVQWNHTCSETTHVQWNHTCTVKPHVYSETTHVQWNHTCTVKSHMYSEATHVQWNHTYTVFFILWSIADYQFKLPFEATNQMVNDYHENGYLIIRLVFLILVFTANHHY
jgi:hypothetical protein